MLSVIKDYRRDNMTKKTIKCGIRFLGRPVLTALTIMALCAGGPAAMVSAEESGSGVPSRVMKTFTVNLSRENVTLTCYLTGTSSDLKNAITRPGIMVFPGGGFVYLSDRETDPVALAWTAEGYNAFVLRYTVRNAGEQVSMEQATVKALADAEEALELIRQNAKAWNTDPDRIACVGFSAGGMLAASLGTTGRVKPNALILGYGTGDPADVTSSTPPAFIFATRKDKLVSPVSSLAFAKALEKAGVDFEVHIFQEGPHGLSLGRTFTSNGRESDVNPVFAQWLPMSADWLRTIWGDFPLENEYSEIALAEPGVLDTPFSDLIQRPALWAAIIEKAPVLKQAASSPAAAAFTINKVAPRIPQLTKEVLAEIEVVAKEYTE
jgi:acetyl esterase/lipase